MNNFAAGNTWVVKVGSSLLTAHGDGLDRSLVQVWADQIAACHSEGVRTVLVSSGAVAEGMQRLELARRPRSLHRLQATAAVGQTGLIQTYESAFRKHGLNAAQILLTHDDLKSRERYLNARSTLNQLLDLGVVPIVNENDAVVTDEIQFGDNDTLAALVVNLIGADTLLLLTDREGMLTANPATHPGAKLIREMPADASELNDMAGGSSELGRGGMITKVRAARIAARSGASTVIASGRAEGVISSLAQGRVAGTLLTSDRKTLVARKQWLASLPVRGHLLLDEGACRVLRQEGRSLLSVGVTETRGEYTRGDVVACLDAEGRELARGLVNYASGDVARICGVPSDQIEAVLGFTAEAELIHRDNLVLV